MSLFEYENIPLEDANYVLRPLHIDDYNKSILQKCFIGNLFNFSFLF